MSMSTELLPPIDRTVWRASSPTAVKIPIIGSRVYYFPQGHAEQCSSEPDFAGVTVSRSCYLLQVNDIRYLVDLGTDEVFVRISLVPLPQQPGPSNPNPSPGEAERIAKAHSKVLTQSDANNGGGFSIPKACATSILPPLDFSATDTPVQTLEMTDLSGKRWTFRHVYRGNPRRHLLTTGWSKFVDAKKIVSGDSLVFIRKDEELFVGIRRRWRSLSEADAESARNAFGFVRDPKGRVAPKAVVDAVRTAEEGRPFDVEFYPGKGTPEVVVDAGTVEEARTAGSAAYAVGAMVRARVAADNVETSSTWRLGTVTSVFDYDGTPWSRSLWRMLQVTWKDQEVISDFRGMSPWEVEPIPATWWVDSPHATAKKPASLCRSDSQATDATKKFEICGGPVRMVATTGGSNAPLRYNNGAAEKPSPLRLSDSLAANATIMFEICDGPSRTVVTTGCLTVPPHNEQATNSTKMFETCNGLVRTVVTTGGSTVPPCDDNVTFSIGMQESEQGPNSATTSNCTDAPPPANGNNVTRREDAMNSGGPPPTPPPPDSPNNITQRQDATDSGNVAQEQIRLFGVTITATSARAGEANGKADGPNSAT